jgi:hypothetical protein
MLFGLFGIMEREEAIGDRLVPVITASKKVGEKSPTFYKIGE